MAVALGPGLGIQEALTEIAWRQEVQETKLILPAQAIGLELVEQVEHGEVATELFAGGFGGEVLGVGLTPVEGDALVIDELEGVVHPRIADRPHAIDEPGLVDLVLAKPDRVEQPRPEIAVDHAHRGVAEHQGQHALASNLGEHLVGLRNGDGRDTCAREDLATVIIDPAGRAPFVEPFHEPGVGRPVGSVGPDS